MNHETDLFVQAFWVKCREVIRPEIDSAIADLRSAGHEANVSTQEFSAVADRLPAHVGPSLTLTLRPADMAEDAAHPWIEFHGDVQRQMANVATSDGHKRSYELAALRPDEAKAQIEEWLARLAISAPV